MTQEAERHDLITIGQSTVGEFEINTVNARDLHEFLEIGKHFGSWINDRIKQYDFKENQDFVIFPETGKKSGRGRPTLEYHLSLDMAKELSMVERTAKGKEARLYFIECERQAQAAAEEPKIAFQFAFNLTRLAENPTPRGLALLEEMTGADLSMLKEIFRKEREKKKASDVRTPPEVLSISEEKLLGRFKIPKEDLDLFNEFVLLRCKRGGLRASFKEMYFAFQRFLAEKHAQIDFPKPRFARALRDAGYDIYDIGGLRWVKGLSLAEGRLRWPGHMGPIMDDELDAARNKRQYRPYLPTLNRLRSIAEAIEIASHTSPTVAKLADDAFYRLKTQCWSAYQQQGGEEMMQ